MKAEGSWPHIDHLWCETRPTLATISSLHVTVLYIANEGKQEGKAWGAQRMKSRSSCSVSV